MAVNMVTRPCVPDARGWRYIEYHRTGASARVELLLSSFGRTDLGETEKSLWWKPHVFNNAAISEDQVLIWAYFISLDKQIMSIYFPLCKSLLL